MSLSLSYLDPDLIYLSVCLSVSVCLCLSVFTDYLWILLLWESLFVLLLTQTYQDISLTDIPNREPYLVVDVCVCGLLSSGLRALESLLSPRVAEATQPHGEQQQGGLPAAL